jgi:anti-sigma-K factor RskA
VDIQAYISSGIIESYVLGLASETDRQEFEQLCLQYPELVKSRNAFEELIEKQAMQYAVRQPRHIREEFIRETKIVAPVRKLNPWKLIAAACLILLAGSIYLNIYLSGKKQSMENQYKNTTADLNEMKRDMEVMEQNPAVKMAALKGQAVSPQSQTTVYWDTVSHSVYVLINNLPVPPSGKQYQMWAIMDSKPIDLGMIDNGYFLKQKKLLIKTQNVQNAQAFAITLEDMGGHSTPKGSIYVMGNP